MFHRIFAGNMADSYYTIEKPGEAFFKDRGSKFLALAFPIRDVSQFKLQLQEIKKEHPKAVHHCFAYKLGTDGNQFRVSDDGEPSGTAGKPILGQLESRQVTDAAIIVTRYFGGTLLGVPGLINAYKSVSAMALQVTPVIQKQVEVNYSLQFDYTTLNDVMNLIKQFNSNILKQDLQLFCQVDLGIPKTRLSEMLYSLGEIRGIEINPI